MTTQQLYDPGSPGPDCSSQSASEVSFPSRKVLVADWQSNHSDDKVGWWSWLGARNYLFADGHCRFLRAQQIHAAVNGWPDPNLTLNGIHGRDM